MPNFCNACIKEAFPVNVPDLNYQVKKSRFSKNHFNNTNFQYYLSIQDASSYTKHFKDTDLSLLHLNVRSLTKNCEKIEELLASMNCLPDIITISETKLNSKSTGNVNLIQISGYNFQATKNGVCVLKKKTKNIFSVEGSAPQWHS